MAQLCIQMNLSASTLSRHSGGQGYGSGLPGMSGGFPERVAGEDTSPLSPGTYRTRAGQDALITNPPFAEPIMRHTDEECRASIHSDCGNSVSRGGKCSTGAVLSGLHQFQGDPMVRPGAGKWNLVRRTAAGCAGAEDPGVVSRYRNAES